MIRFFNGRLLTMDGGTALTDDEVWVDGAEIAYVGPARADAPAFQRQIDLKGDLLMPGFKNAHTHSAMTFLRSFADDLPLQAWLNDRVFPLEARLKPEHIYPLARLAILDYLAGGITASFDMYFYNDAYVQANLDSGFRTVLCGSCTQFDAELEKVEREYDKFNAIDPKISYRLGFHAEYTADERVFRYMQYLKDKYRAPVFSHNAETKSEVKACIQRHGMTPTAYAESLGLYDYGGGGFHCVWTTPEDWAIFRRRGLWAVSCPASNAKLASGIAPLDAMAAAGVQIALGTDGPASNNALDMFREIYMACVLQKLRGEDAAAGDPAAMLTAATVGGAGAMGLDNCRVIRAGQAADLIVIDMTRPQMQPVLQPVKNLVYSGSRDCVRMTMIAGRILYENGEFFVGKDPAEIYAEAAQAVAQLTAEE